MNLSSANNNDIKLIIQDGQKNTNTRLDRLEALVKENKVRVNELRVLNKNIDTRLFGNEVLLEDTNSTVKHMIEMLSDNLKVKTQVNEHEVRLTDIEANQPSIISTLALHSKQLKI